MSMKILGPNPYFWQWDTGRKLVIDNTDCEEVHFYNGTGTSALVVTISTAEDGTRVAEVPNILLQSAKTIRAYLYQQHENNGMTLTMCAFQVVARIKPADYVYTETEVKSYELLSQKVLTLETLNRALAYEAKELNDGLALLNGRVDELAKSSSGLSQTAAALLITILQSGSFAVEQNDNIKALAVELGVEVKDDPVIPDEPDEPDVPAPPVVYIHTAALGVAKLGYAHLGNKYKV